MKFLKTHAQSIALLLCIIIAAVGSRYQYTLSQSQKSAQDIENRAVIDKTVLDERETSPEAYIYRAEQNEMEDIQEGLAQDIQKMQQAESPVTLASGSFNRLDPIHRAEGNIEIVENGDDIYVIFSSDFTTANGPDLYVILSNDAKLYTSDSLNLGPLTDTAGKQIYKITRQERETYNGAIQIRCRAFDVLFSVAELG